MLDTHRRTNNRGGLSPRRPPSRVQSADRGSQQCVLQKECWRQTSSNALSSGLSSPDSDLTLPVCRSTRRSMYRCCCPRRSSRTVREPCATPNQPENPVTAPPLITSATTRGSGRRNSAITQPRQGTRRQRHVHCRNAPHLATESGQSCAALAAAAPAVSLKSHPGTSRTADTRDNPYIHRRDHNHAHSAGKRHTFLQRGSVGGGQA